MIAFDKKELTLIFQRTLLVFFIGYCFIPVLVFNFTNTSNQQFVYLADSFLHGQTHFRELPGSYRDLIWQEGKFYWHLGPFPAVLLMPFVIFWGTTFLQGYVQFFLTLLNFYLLYRIALILGMKKKIHALWLGFGYIFATMYLPAALLSDSWRFAQVVATSLLLFAILEYITKRRFWLIGIVLAFLIATRFHLVLALAFFIVGILTEKAQWKEKLTASFHLMAPVIVMGVILLFYNYVRFDDIFETGYRYVPSGNVRFGLERHMEIAFQYSGEKLFSLLYLPTNIYYYILQAPSPILLNPQSHILIPPYLIVNGQESYGILISAPLFLFALMASTKEKLVRQSWIAAGLIFMLLLLHYVANLRYLLDLAPFLFVILVRTLAPTLHFPIKILMIATLIFYLLSSSFPSAYPQFLGIT
ncbi:MAG: hypothetical protein HY001_01610 [Candidatus Portnoybacteria bacterium]|nr:hypothetical protein [Candidatus Portnoybacteria bacterium]